MSLLIGYISVSSVLIGHSFVIYIFYIPLKRLDGFNHLLALKQNNDDFFPAYNPIIMEMLPPCQNFHETILAYIVHMQIIISI